MSRIDIYVTIDGTPIPLPTDVATLVTALVEHRDLIHKQGGGVVLLNYLGVDADMKLLRQTYSGKARRLVDRITSQRV